MPTTQDLINAYHQATGTTGPTPYDNYSGAITAQDLENIASFYGGGGPTTTPTASTSTSTSTIGTVQSGTVTAADIQALFEKYGVDPGTTGSGAGTSAEDPGTRFQRIANEVNAGTRDIHDVEVALTNLGGAKGDSAEQQILALFAKYGIPLDFGANPGETAEQRLARLVKEVEGGRTFANIEEALVNLKARKGDQITIRPGAQWYKVGTEFYAVYQLPGGSQIYLDSSATELSSIFPGNIPDAYIELSPQQWSNTIADAHYIGSISEAESATGETWEKATQAALVGAAGGLLPSWLMNSPEVNDLLFISEAENWSPDKLLEEISQLPSFNERFPAIKHFYDLGLDVSEAVDAYRSYESHVGSLTQAYYGRKATPQEIAGIINQGYSAESLTSAFATFDRMREYAPAFEAFNSILQGQGMNALDEAGIFDFLSGNAEPEYYQLYEASSVLEASNTAGLGKYVSAADAYRFAQATPGITSPQQAYNQMQQAASDILRYRGEIDMGRFGLNAEDMIDMALGLAPRSGISQAELQENMERALNSAKSWLTRTANPYFSYTSKGTPQATSLANLTQEGV